MNSVTRRRLATVALAPAAAVAAWAILRVDGVEFSVTTGDGTVGVLDVAVSALVGALGAWAVVRLLERYSPRPGFWWPPIGSTALAVSTMGPAYFSDGVDALALTALHFATAIVVITGFATTLPVRCNCGRRGLGAHTNAAP
jgi:Family of unknown function (DUF6069)